MSHSHSTVGGHSHQHGSKQIDEHELTHQHHHSSPQSLAKKQQIHAHDGHHKADHDSDQVESIVPIASFLWNVGNRVALTSNEKLLKNDMDESKNANSMNNFLFQNFD
jgi:hypothetical protein